MQTFLPLPDFKESASVLDNLRLNKQIVEASQIHKNITTIPENRDRWANHPAVLMWENHTLALEYYMKVFIEEWWSRGKLGHSLLYDSIIEPTETVWLPDWFKDSLFHASHRSNLLLKESDYNRFGWVELNEPYIPYVWFTYYSNFIEKIFTEQGIKLLIKGIKRRNLWKEDHFQWPGSYPEWEIYLGSTKLGSSPYSK